MCGTIRINKGLFDWKAYFELAHGKVITPAIKHVNYAAYAISQCQKFHGYAYAQLLSLLPVDLLPGLALKGDA